MSRDITRILEGWEFEPNQVSVRIVQGDDGREKIQMRMDLGLLQMEVNGRPDGQRPEGFDSWLEYYQHQQRQHEQTQPDSVYLIETSDCERLLREGIQYYHRYLSFWHLRRYELCARDTTRNLRLFRFVREHARQERDKRQFDQWRPYVTMMHTRAVATPLVELQDLPAAITAIEAGIISIRQFLEEYDQLERAGQCSELLYLQRWRDELLAQSPPPDAPPAEPPSVLGDLQRQLTEAIAAERFEEAAQLRDEIRRRSEAPFQPPSGEKL